MNRSRSKLALDLLRPRDIRHGTIVAVASNDTIVVLTEDGVILKNVSMENGVVGQDVTLTRDGNRWYVLGGTSGTRLVGALPSASVPSRIGEGPGIDIERNYIGLGLDSVLIQSKTAQATEYSSISLAVAAAVNGDTILLASRTYNESFTLPAGVTLKSQADRAVINGLVTMSNGSALRDVKVSRISNSVEALRGVYCPFDSRLENVLIEVANSGGPAYALHIDGGSTVEAVSTDLIAETGTPGYAAYVENGSLYHSYGLALGSTEYEPYYEV